MIAAPWREADAPAVVQYDVMTLLGPSALGEPVVGELRHTGGAAGQEGWVTLTLHSAIRDLPGHSWTFEQRLLDVGCDEPVSGGRVRVSPVWHPHGGTAVLLELDVEAADRTGACTVSAELPAIRRFVDMVHRHGSALSVSSCFTTHE